MAAKKESKHVIRINGQLSMKTAKSENAITEKQRRLAKLKKKKKKKLKSIGKRHPEFELTYDMMLGIRYAVSLSEPSVSVTTTTRTRTVTTTHTLTATHTNTKSTHNKQRDEHLSIYNASSASTNASINESISMSSDDTESDFESDDERLIESEFLETKKYKFPSSGSETTPAHQMSDFKFKDYCPQIFRQLREWFRISTQEYLVTICGDFKLLEFISNSKSGQFFFFSHNSQFIIKTMTRTESIFLRKILPSYYTYVSQQPDTLLPKFYGMHRVKRKKQKIYFLIQQNVFYSDVDDIHDQYDLKGSTQGRRATKAERKKGAILKDLDWVDETKKIRIGRQRAKIFKDQLKRDTHWLRREKIMDYSLLVGIHYLDRAQNIKKNSIKYDANSSPIYKHQMLVDHSSNNMYIEEEEDINNGYQNVLKTVEESKEEQLCLHALKEADDEENDDEENNEIIIIEEEEIAPEKLMIDASRTSHTGDMEEAAVLSPSPPIAPIIDVNNNNNEDDNDKTRRHSADDAFYSNGYLSRRRNSAPNIASPRALVDVNSGNRYKFRMDSMDDDPVHQTPLKRDRNISHTTSQSVQIMDLDINNVCLSPQPQIYKNYAKPSLRATNSERQQSLRVTNSERQQFKIRSNTSTTIDTKAYRGHISVKHPKRYKRKTAAEMQFAVDDIDIPRGIKHEVHNSIFDDILKNRSRSVDKEDKSDFVVDFEEKKKKVVHLNSNEYKLTKSITPFKLMKSDDGSNSNNSNNSNTMKEELKQDDLNAIDTDSGDICPWTTFHGGMVYEGDDDHYDLNEMNPNQAATCAQAAQLGNEVYFVGLIDILQKYNKRKKLENWIKKMKYDSNAISAAPPDIYAQRMCDFFEDKVV